MELRITRNTGKSHSMVYKRTDGSETWQAADDFFVRHDLSHFAIEKTLGYTSAFMGMINRGMGIRDFEDREKRKKMTISAEAWYAENMANLFLMEIVQGELEDFNSVSQEAYKKMELPFPPPILQVAEINSIRLYLKKLLQQ